MEKSIKTIASPVATASISPTDVCQPRCPADKVLHPMTWFFYDFVFVKTESRKLRFGPAPGPFPKRPLSIGWVWIFSGSRQLFSASLSPQSNFAYSLPPNFSRVNMRNKPAISCPPVTWLHWRFRQVTFLCPELDKCSCRSSIWPEVTSCTWRAFLKSSKEDIVQIHLRTLLFNQGCQLRAVLQVMNQGGSWDVTWPHTKWNECPVLRSFLFLDEFFWPRGQLQQVKGESNSLPLPDPGCNLILKRCILKSESTQIEKSVYIASAKSVRMHNM